MVSIVACFAVPDVFLHERRAASTGYHAKGVLDYSKRLER
jgi:hypothetical protein